MNGVTTGATGTTTAAPPAIPPTTQVAAAGVQPPEVGGSPAAATGAPPAPGWMTDLSAEDRGHLENKGYKSVPDLVKAYRNAESLIGKVTGATPEQLLVLPKDDADGSGRRQALAKLGVPDKPEGYGFKPTDPKEDPAFSNKVAEIAHKHSLPMKEAVGFVKDVTSVLEDMAKSQKATAEAKLAADLQQGEAKLKAEWGQDYDRRVAVSKQAAAALGIDEPVQKAIQSAIGADGLVKFVFGLTERLGEAPFVQGNKTGARSMTPDGAKDKVAELRGNPEFVRRLAQGDAAAKREWQDAFKAMHPEQ